MKIALGLDFNGQAYRGWQTQQAGVDCVQTRLETAIARVANHSIVLHAAGRTDAGVHASGMVAHFETDANRPLRSWMLGVNTHLPDDIAIRWAASVNDDFHARFKAIARRYRYVIYNHPQRSSQLAGQVTWHYHAVDVNRMREAAAHLVGIHNFQSFRAVACQSRNPVRHVHFLRIIERKPLIIIDIQADGFLHHMVRNIAGVLLAIGQGKQEPNWAKSVLDAEDRTLGGVTAPPDGLYFIDVHYPERFVLPKEPLGPIWLGDINAISP